MKPGRLISPPGTYFVTFSTWQRRRLFIVESYVRLFLKTMYRHRREGRFQLHAFVLMPEHVHLLLTPDNNVTIEHAVQLIRSLLAYPRRNLGAPPRNLATRIHRHRVRGAQDFAHHRNYIHRNPVERHLVSDASEFRYSSAYPGFRLTRGPQRLKPNSQRAPDWHEWNSCPSRLS